MRIAEISARSGLSEHTIRYYEKMGHLPKPARDASGWRDYDESNLVLTEFLLRLKATGMPLEQIKRYTVLRDQGDITIEERQDLLVHHREKVLQQAEELAASLARLDDKTEQYENMKVRNIK